MARNFSFSSIYQLEVTTADPAGLLNRLLEEGIYLSNVEYISDLTLNVTLLERDYSNFLYIADKTAAAVKVCKISGIRAEFSRMRKRPVIMLFALIVMMAGMFIPTRVLFLEIEGNVNVSSNKILEAADICGLRFLASRRQIRSEKIKNQLLELIPELQWVGINTVGCRAVIFVEEKELPSESKVEKGIPHIVASRDCVIENFTVLKGNVLCTVGQAVTEGELLVSGYHDLGIATKVTGADGEVYGRTLRDLSVKTLPSCFKKEVKGETKTVIRLIIGKNIINLTKDSGILDTTCGKIYSEEYVKLPGGFQLPLGMIKETVQYFDTEKLIRTSTGNYQWLVKYAQDYLRKQMVSGSILSAYSEFISNDCVFLKGQYQCYELVSRIKYEGIIPKDEENGRKNN